MRLIAAFLFSIPIALATLVADGARTSAQQAVPADPAGPRPPLAEKRPKLFEEHGRQRVDDYYWLKERDDPAVIAYLQAENAYADVRLAPLKPLVEKIRDEMVYDLDGTMVRAPFRDGGYIYQTTYDKGADYPVIVRRRVDGAGPVETVLDAAQLAKGHSQFNLDKWVISPGGTTVAYAVDYSGNSEHHLYVRSVATGELLDDLIEDADDDIVFSADGEAFFYVSDSKVWRHDVGADPDTDALIYEETDRTFSVSLSLSKSRQFVFINIDHEQTSEVRYLRADAQSGVKVMLPRRKDQRYFADHVDGRFYIRTNIGAPDFKIMTAAEGASVADWVALVPETPGRYISGMEVFDDFIALQEEHDAIVSLRVVRLSDRQEMTPPAPAGIGVNTLDPQLNHDPSSRRLQFVFEGPTDPKAVYEFDLDRGEVRCVAQCPAAERFPRGRYTVTRVHARAGDGALVPVTLVYRPDLRRAGGNPALITGYGAYGSSLPPGYFSLWRPLVDRGFVFAMAHVRGGRELGQLWYDQGRLLNKRNTFTDFIAATEALIAQGYADRAKVFAHGASAGGLLMGGIANMRPDLYAGIVAEVPYVDVVTSMSDPTVPLTTYEYQEWGDPAVREQYEVMLSYSPYDNVAAHDYPAMLVTAGFKDAQVDYREAAKWVAKLRATKTNDSELLLSVDMDSGHLGASGRVRSLGAQALIDAWILSRAQ